MSGFILDQTNVSIQIDIGAGNVDFPCVTNYDTGTPSTSFVDVSCFSTPTVEPEYATGRKTVSAGSIAYNVSEAGDVHQYLLANQANKVAVPVELEITFPDGATYTRTQSYLIGGVSEPVEFDGIYVATVELQPTGAITRAYGAAPV